MRKSSDGAYLFYERERAAQLAGCSFRFCVLRRMEGIQVKASVLDDKIVTDDCKIGSVSCPSWDDDNIECFFDGDNDKAKEDPWNRSPNSEYVYGDTSVLKESILTKKRILVEKCLEVLKKASRAVPEEYIKLALQYSSPMVIKAIREYSVMKER